MLLSTAIAILLVSLAIVRKVFAPAPNTASPLTSIVTDGSPPTLFRILNTRSSVVALLQTDPSSSVWKDGRNYDNLVIFPFRTAIYSSKRAKRQSLDGSFARNWQIELTSTFIALMSLPFLVPAGIYILRAKVLRSSGFPVLPAPKSRDSRNNKEAEA
jgi:hypothetical protein